METPLVFIFALFACAGAQYMSSWGSSTGGYTNQMQMPMGYHHMPYHHLREATIDAVPYNPKTEAILPIPVMRSKVPARLGLQDYSLMSVAAPEHDDMTEHLIYRQTMGDVKRPVVGVLSLLSSPMPMSMGSMGSMSSMGSSMGTKASPSYSDSSADELMTCIGMDVSEPLKAHTSEPRIIFNRAFPYYTQVMHKIKQ